MSQQEIIDGFYNKLITTVGPLVDNRIYENIADQDTDLPSIIFTIITDENLVKSPDDDSLIRMQVSVNGKYSNAVKTTRAISDAVYDALNRCNFTTHGFSVEVYNRLKGAVIFDPEKKWLTIVQEYEVYGFEWSSSSSASSESSSSSSTSSSSESSSSSRSSSSSSSQSSSSSSRSSSSESSSSSSSSSNSSSSSRSSSSSNSSSSSRSSSSSNSSSSSESSSNSSSSSESSSNSSSSSESSSNSSSSSDSSSNSSWECHNLLSADDEEFNNIPPAGGWTYGAPWERSGSRAIVEDASHDDDLTIAVPGYSSAKYYTIIVDVHRSDIDGDEIDIKLGGSTRGNIRDGDTGIRTFEDIQGGDTGSDLVFRTDDLENGDSVMLDSVIICEQPAP